MTKQEKVWALNEELGEHQAMVQQQVADAEKAEHYESWFKKEVLGRKSNYKSD